MKVLPDERRFHLQATNGGTAVAPVLSPLNDQGPWWRALCSIGATGQPDELPGTALTSAVEQAVAEPVAAALPDPITEQ
jgi:hypothetical protein